jgi:serine/threonine-protein kinase
MSAKRAMDIIRQVTLALQHAYQQKIVHRDIKPSNLLIRKDGLVKLADMGLARSVDESLETNITRAGTTVGTVDYMSPEQARNSKAADIRSDMYSLGATWFHLLTGHPPFPEGSLLNKLNAHSGGPRPDVRDENESVSETVSVMIKRLMAIKPEDRYQNPTELLEDLENENLTRGPTSLKDLARLAEEDDGDNNVADQPKASYKKPAAKEARQLAAATMEIPVQKLPTSEPAAAGGMNLASLKPLGIGAAVIAAISCLGYIASQYGGAVGPSTTPGSNPFDHSQEIVSASPVTPVSEEKKSGPKPATVGEAKGPKPVDTSDASKATTKKDNSTTAPSSAGALYFPPIAPLGRDGEVKHIPEWITETGSPAAANLKRVSVGGGLNGFEQVATIEQALKELPPAGGIVELITDGPYFLSPMQLTNRATIVLRAANGTTPVVVLVAEPDQPYDALLQISNGTLTLEGLQVLVYARQFANNDPLTFVSVRSGDLAVVRCSFTLLGNRAGKSFAFGAEGQVLRSDPKQSSRPRVLVRESIVRGAALGGFNLDQTQTDLVASRCVFATGSAPLLSLTNHDQPVDGTPPPKPAAGGAKTGNHLTATSSDEKKPAGPKSLKPANSPTTKGSTSVTARSLRFLSCTVLAGGTAFEIAPGVDVTKPPATEVLIANSVLAGVNVPQATPVLLALPGWPQALLPGNDQSLYPGLNWQMESSAVCGWQKLILGELGETKVIRDGAAWKEIWRNQPSLETSQFQAISWPKTPPAEFAALSANELDLPHELGLKGSDGQTPGCSINDFAIPTPLTLARADALADRAAYPITGIELFAENRRIEVDANSQDLGRVLGQDNWPNGTVVVVSGQGNVEMTPVEVKGKSLRVEFRSNGEAPLVLSPRKSSKMKDDEAMFIVENGSLELVDGLFYFPNGSSSPLPAHFLAVHDGNFALRRCQVTGQMLEGTTKFQGLIRWKRIEVEPRDFHSPQERNSGVISDCALLTSGKLFDADLRNRTLLLRNSLFASVGDLLDLNVQGFNARIGGTLDARWCTFGAGGKFLFQVRGTKEAEKTIRPLNVFLQHCVLLSLTDLSNASASPVLLSARDFVLTNQQIAWWDQGNGYATPWTQFIRAAETPAAESQSFDSHWRKPWGETHVANSLIANGDVSLAAKLPHRTKVAPRDFLLASNCAASSWGPNQTPIGFNIERWSATASSPSRATSPATTKPDSLKTAPKKNGPLPPNKTTKPNF